MSKYAVERKIEIIGRTIVWSMDANDFDAIYGALMQIQDEYFSPQTTRLMPIVDTFSEEFYKNKKHRDLIMPVRKVRCSYCGYTDIGYEGLRSECPLDGTKLKEV